MRSLDEVMESSLYPRKDKIIHLSEIKDASLGEAYPTGIIQLDNSVLGGIRGGDLWIIGGISKHGKTQFSLQMTKNFSSESSETGVIPVLWFSYEIPVRTLKWRLNQMGVDVNKVLIYVPLENISDKVEWIEDRILDAKKRFDTQIVFIDNLDFIGIEERKSDDRNTMQKRIVGMLKRIAIANNLAIILNVHVRKTEGRRKPNMQDIFGASETYKLADLCLIIYRKLKDNDDWDNQEFIDESDLIIDGNRLTGKNKTIKLKFKNNQFYEI